jgi:hypothetical protein
MTAPGGSGVRRRTEQAEVILQGVLNEQAVIAAWLRVRALVTSNAPVNLEELRGLEQALRPVAGVAEIQQALVPLLDHAGLHGLAMAWDGEPPAVGDEWLRTRFERWLALRAPELAFLTLAQLQGRGAAHDDDRPRATALLDQERALRTPMLARNLSALDAVDPELCERVRSSPRLSLVLRPLGAGMVEYTGGGGPPLQLWAATPDEAAAEAARLVARCSGREVWFIAGVGDGTMALAAASTFNPNQRCTVHLVEGHLVRLRGLLEIADLAVALRTRRVRLHGGAPAADTLLDVLVKLPPLDEEAVIGGDQLALSILESARQRVATG